VYIDDFIAGAIAVLEHGESGTIYHLGTEEERTIRDVLERMGSIFGCTLTIHTGPTPAGETPRRCPDVSRLRALGFEPKIDFDWALAETLRWYRENEAPAVS
jgi:nucleoside-diphosphate-sugar epimerase